MNREPNPLADKKLIIGVIAVIGFTIAWQSFMAKRYPNAGAKSTPSASTPVHGTALPAQEPKLNELKGSMAETLATGDVIKPETLLTYEDEKVRFTVSSHGLGLKEYVIKGYKAHDGQPIRLGFSPLGGLFETRFGQPARPLDYELKEIESGVFEGTAHNEAGVFVQRLKYNRETGSFENNVTISSATPEISKGISILVPDAVRSTGSSSWLFPSYERQDFFVGHSGTTETVSINHAKTDVKNEYKEVSFLSVGDQYFSTAILDHSNIAPVATAQVDVGAKTAAAEVIYRPVGASGDISLRQIFYAGPKEMETLKRIDPQMASIIDFGWLSVIARPLLFTLKAIHALVGNWGLAIIFLTLLVRGIVLPFNLMSVRSMKAMQRIQPLMQQARERYKDDPAAQQREIMSLMKEHKANPLGGCLPMLIQIPIFFAMYRVIGSSVDIYQQPFMGWLHDLSAHDPFYILPVLMGVTMFFQSKMTPMTSMDPAQAKIMQYLPLVFTVFMLQLPSGLTLYMLVSSVFGVVQQWFVQRDRGALVPATAK